MQNSTTQVHDEWDLSKYGGVPVDSPQSSNDKQLTQSSNDDWDLSKYGGVLVEGSTQPPQQTETQGNPQEEETINLFGSPYLWVSKAKKRAEGIDRTVNVLSKVATNKSALDTAGKVAGNTAKAFLSGVAGGVPNTVASIYNIPASVSNIKNQVMDKQGLDKEAYAQAESMMGGEIPYMPYGGKVPTIPSITHFLSDAMGVHEKAYRPDGKVVNMPLVKPAQLVGEVASGGLLKKGIEKGIEKGLVHSSEAMDTFKSFLNVTGSMNPKVLASAGVFGLVEDEVKRNGGGDGQALMGGLLASLVTDYAFRKGINTVKALNQIGSMKEDKLFNLFQNYLANSISLKDSSIDLIKKYGGNPNLALATDNGFIKLFVGFIKRFGGANSILKEGAKTHGKEVENALDNVMAERLNESLSHKAEAVAPQELSLDETLSYMNTPVRGDNVFSSAGSNEAVAIGGSLKSDVQANQINKQKQILEDHKQASKQTDEFIKSVKSEQKETEAFLKSEKERLVQEELQSNVDSLYGHLGESSNPQFAGEYAVDAFKLEKDARKIKKNQLYGAIDYKDAKGKPEQLLAYFENTLKNMKSPIKSEDEKTVIKKINEFMEASGVKISDALKKKHGYSRDGGYELPAEVLLDQIKLATGKNVGQLKDFTAEELSSLVRSLGNSLKHEEQIGVKKLLEGGQKVAESELETILRNAGNEKAIAKRQEANKYYREEIIGKNYSTVGKGIVKGDLPKSPLSYMNSVDGIKLVQKTLGNSEQSKEAFRMLKEAKIKELFLDKIRNPDGTINVSKFQGFFNKKDMAQEALQELMGKERFFHFKQTALTSEQRHMAGLEEGLKRLQQDTEIRLKAAENLKEGISTRHDEMFKSAKGTIGLDQVARNRLEIFKMLDNPNKLGKESKQSLEALLKSTEADLKKHFGKDEAGFKNYALGEQEKVLEQRQDMYRKHLGRGISNPTTETISWGKLSNYTNKKETRQYLENIAGKENMKKLDELTEWSSSIRDKVEDLNPSGTAPTKEAMGAIKWGIKGLIGGGSWLASWMFNAGALGATAVGAGTAMALGGRALKATGRLAEVSAKVLSDHKFFDLALAIKNNPSLTKIERFKEYLKERTGIGIQELNDLYVTALEEQVSLSTH